VAAYNAGAGAVNHAITKANSRDFYTLQYFLPAETRNHVKKFIATHYYFEGGGGWTTLTAAETEKYRSELITTEENQYKNILANTGSIEIKGKFNGSIISKDLDVETTLFNHLNPNIDKILAEGKSYQLTLPQDKIELFKSSKSQILAESVQALFSSVMNDEQTASNK
jgi:membrane-bound lytic murein transglycosylase D